MKLKETVLRLLLFTGLVTAVAAHAAAIVPGNVTATLWPGGAHSTFIDEASTGGGTDFDAPSANFDRSFGSLNIGPDGTRIIIRGIGWATSGTVADVPATSATVTITYLGANGVSGGGDDVVVGSVTDAFVYNGTASEMVWFFDTPLVATNDGLNNVYHINIAANGNIRYKTQPNTSGAANVKLSVAGVSEAVANQLEITDPPVPAVRYELDGTNLFSVTAFGPSPPDYQWCKAPSTPIAGATGSVFTLDHLNQTDAGNYFVVVTSGPGNSVTSAPVALTVNPWTLPTFTAQPMSATVELGQSASFTVQATGSPPWSLTYQWHRNGSPVAGATGSTLTFPYATSADDGSYFVTVSNAVGVSNSASATLAVQVPAFPHKALFAAGGLFNQQVADLRNSGFDTAILWSVHVNASGAISLNNDTLVDAGGTYVYGQWARNNCALLKQAPTTIRRIEFSVGAYGAADFEGIESLVNKSPANGGGTGPGSILRRNFQALHNAFPQVDAIDFDDESNYDVASTAAFALMLADLGYQVTFCPYTRRTTFWGPLYQAIEAVRPGTVDHVYLQCYAGGGFNSPITWNPSFSPLKVEPGLWAGLGSVSGRSDPSEVETQLNNWRAGTDIPGGFIWRLDYATEGGYTLRDYAAAINGTYSAAFDGTRYYKFINQYSGKALMARDETTAGVPADGTLNGAEIAQGTYNGDDPRFDWRIEDAGGGFRKIISRYSGKAMAVFGTGIDGVTTLDRTNNGAEIAQWEYLGNDWYQWRITDAGDGYKIMNRNSGKAAAVFAADTSGASSDRAADGADVGQWQYLGNAWYNWDIVAIEPPRFASLSITNGTLRAMLKGEPRATLTIQSSPSLQPGSWVDEQSISVDAAGQAVFMKSVPADAKGFYRAVPALAAY